MTNFKNSNLICIGASLQCFRKALYLLWHLLTLMQNQGFGTLMIIKNQRIHNRECIVSVWAISMNWWTNQHNWSYYWCIDLFFFVNEFNKLMRNVITIKLPSPYYISQSKYVLLSIYSRERWHYKDVIFDLVR